MGNKIRLLPDDVINQIAAGEVIERPASVVKELVENAVDAGATLVDVEVEHGGLGLIRVTDNGTGMTPEDAGLSLQRHATSKLHSSADLFALRTLGFRGEALPSIASVSQFSLTTRTAEDDAGFSLQVSQGRFLHPGKPVGAAVGTQIEVRELLGNVPARLKFMKSEATEFSHIHETVLRMALAWPHVGFRLKKSGKEVFSVPVHATLLERVQAALGSRADEGLRLAFFDAVNQNATMRFHVCLAGPQHDQATGKHVFLFVNHRFVRDRSLLHAVTSGFGTTLAAGRFPQAVVHVSVDPRDVDVNVHPQKLEVRFTNPGEVYAWLQKTVQGVVERAPWMRGEGVEVANALRQRESATATWTGEGGFAAEERPRYIPPGVSPVRAFGQAERVAAEAGSGFRLPPVEQARWSFDDVKQVSNAGTGLRFGAMAYLGQVYMTYLVCRDEAGLLLIDQHAAHERVAYERLLHASAHKGVPSQRLLLPISLEGAQCALIEEHSAALEKAGFGFRKLGEDEMTLVEVPNGTEFGRGAKTYQEPKTLLTKVLAEIEEFGTSHTAQQRMEKVLATIACHSVLRAGDPLTDTQARALLESMDEFDIPPYCPHGRPVLIRLEKAELEKRFNRC